MIKCTKCGFDIHPNIPCNEARAFHTTKKIKFTDHHTFTQTEFETEDKILYRTCAGNYWERLYGESWEPVFLEEEDACINAYKEYKGLR